MIQRLQSSNINFKSNYSPALQATINSSQNTQQSVVEVQEEPKKSFSVKEAYSKAKRGVTNTIKGFNNITNIGGGLVKGVTQGGIAAATIAVVGKNIKNADGKIWGTVKGIGKDLGGACWTALKAIPCIITKSPLDNIKSLASASKNGAKAVWNGIGKHKLTSAIAGVSALAIFAYKAIQGKVQANQKNADLDHKTNQGHV